MEDFINNHPWITLLLIAYIFAKTVESIFESLWTSKELDKE